MPTYEDPTENMTEAYDAVRALDCHRERLAEVDIVVLGVYATRDKDDEPRGEALSVRGRPLLGKIRITTLEDRVAGNADVRVLLHGDRWGGLSGPMQRAVIDDCLTQIEVLMEDGKPKRDDHGRPKLRRRGFDYEVAGFHDVDERHGRSSVAVHNLRVMFDQHGQIYLPHLDPDDAPADAMITAPRTPRPRARIKGDPGYQRGTLAQKRLRERVGHLDRIETILAVAKLELQHRPREGVVDAVKAKVLEHHKLLDYVALTNGEPLSVELDMAAGVLVTTPARPKVDILDRLVPECRDPVVLGWLLDDEREREDKGRAEVIHVVETRLAEIRA